jgi:hypothetical protein
LKIKPIDYREIDDWRNMQESVAMSA